MPKISSAAADSRLLTRSLISSALNILAEDSDSSKARWPAGVGQLEPSQYPDGGIKYREITPNTPPPPSLINSNLLPSTLFSLLYSQFSLVPEAGKVFNKLIRNSEHFYCENKDHDLVPEGRPKGHEMTTNCGGGVYI